VTEHFGFVTLTAAAPGEPRSGSEALAYARALEALGGEEWRSAAVADPAPLVALVATGGTERTILDLWRRRLETAARAPVLLVAHSGENSLGASLEALARLRQDGLAGRILYLESPDDAAGLARVSESVADVKARGALRQARIGVVGSPSGWLVASSPDPEVVRATWGPQVLPVSFEQLVEAIREATGEAAHSLKESLVSGASEVREPSDGEIEVAVHVSTAIRQLAERYGLSGVALRCFDLIEEFGATGCVALSDAADRGVAAGCEGDVVATLAMLWVRVLFGEIAWMANPSRVDVPGNTLVLAHCTVPRSIVDRYTLRSHFESGKGVAIQGELPEGPVTLVRIGGRDLKELWLAEGTILRPVNAADLCRTQVEVRLDEDGACAELLKRPLGNHVVLLRGSRARRMRSWWELIIAD